VQEGQTYTGAIGSISDTDPNSTAGNFSATFSLNGASYAVSVDGSGGSYSLDVANIGPFTLADSGSTGTITVSGPGDTQTADVGLTVTDAPISASGNPNLTATVGQNWTDVVATITDQEAEKVTSINYLMP
jgi:hypothetical protein